MPEIIAPQPGEIIYGPYPFRILDRRKANHYCLVLDYNEEARQYLLTPGTSSGIDKYPRDCELQIDKAAELRCCNLRRATRFDLKTYEWLSLEGFISHSTVEGCSDVLFRLERAMRFAGLL